MNAALNFRRRQGVLILPDATEKRVCRQGVKGEFTLTDGILTESKAGAHREPKCHRRIQIAAQFCLTRTPHTELEDTNQGRTGVGNDCEQANGAKPRLRTEKDEPRSSLRQDRNFCGCRRGSAQGRAAQRDQAAPYSVRERLSALGQPAGNGRLRKSIPSQQREPPRSSKDGRASVFIVLRDPS